jgi:signal transduction histidine kinase
VSRTIRSPWRPFPAALGLSTAIGVVGLAATAVAASLARLSLGDAAALVGYAAGGAAATGCVAGGLLFLLRRSSVVAQALVSALVPVVAVAIGVAAASWAMFISTEDLHVLFVILAAAGTVGVISALLLGQRVAAAGRSLGAMARRLGDEGPGARLEPSAGGRPALLEMALLAAELESTSARLAEYQDRAAALDRSRRELVAWVSHDLRTPLAGIRAMVEAIEDGVVSDTETVARYHRTIRQETERLAHLVDDLFELSKIHAGALALDLQQVLLDDLISDALASASVPARAKGVELRGVMNRPSPIVTLSTPEMARVVRNLLDNAIRHTPPGRTIRVEAGIDETGTAARVSVLDGCGGIPEHELDQVFETAYRGDDARTPGDGGAGLGLAVARGLVEAHHGDISVHNEDGGCRFTVRLPLSEPVTS